MATTKRRSLSRIQLQINWVLSLLFLLIQFSLQQESVIESVQSIFIHTPPYSKFSSTSQAQNYDPNRLPCKYAK